MILLFDLAGLLLDFRGIESTLEISGRTVDAERFERCWSESHVADRLYRGHCTLEEFAAGAVAEWSSNISPERSLAAFGQWLIGDSLPLK